MTDAFRQNEHERQCPICGGSGRFLFEARDRNRRVTQERFVYLRCTVCATIMLAEAPADHSLYYAQPDERRPPSLSQLARLAAEGRHRIEIVRRHATGGRLVDIGAGVGVFAYQAKQAGFDVSAIEMDPACCEYMSSTVGVSAISSGTPEQALATLPPSRVITFWHALEHLGLPRESVAAAARNLEPGGIVVVATPNPHALQFRMLKSRWPHVDAPRHLFLIPAPTLISLAREGGLEPIELTASDPGARFWNRFGWQFGLAAPGAPSVVAAAARVLGASVAAAMRPLEHRDLHGSTYTVVFRKRG